MLNSIRKLLKYLKRSKSTAIPLAKLKRIANAKNKATLNAILCIFERHQIIAPSTTAQKQKTYKSILTTDFFVQDNILIKYLGDDERVCVPNGITHIGIAKIKNEDVQDFWWYISPWNFAQQPPKEIILPDTIVSIGKGVFSDTKITEFVMPNSVTTMGVEVFGNCKTLKKVLLSQSLNTIESRTFVNCKNLREVTFFSKVKLIDKNAFFGCDNLTDVYFYGSENDWAKIRIEETNQKWLKNTKIHFCQNSPK